MSLKGIENHTFYYQLSATCLMCAAGESTQLPLGNMTWVIVAKIEMTVQCLWAQYSKLPGLRQ